MGFGEVRGERAGHGERALGYRRRGFASSSRYFSMMFTCVRSGFSLVSQLERVLRAESRREKFSGAASRREKFSGPNPGGKRFPGINSLSNRIYNFRTRFLMRFVKRSALLSRDIFGAKPTINSLRSRMHNFRTRFLMRFAKRNTPLSLGILAARGAPYTTT